MKKFIEKLHFITHDIEQLSHVEQAQIACEAGAKWIQYRCLTKSEEELLKDINQIAEICDDWGATLIVTDHIKLHGKADIQGFHMEDTSTDFIKLRSMLGDDVTLGGSANTLEELIRLANEEVDYAGYGPFSHTDTKPNDFPHLGIEGYIAAMNTLSNLKSTLPILAVGGVGIDDIEGLLSTGIFGIAASSAINQSMDMRAAYLEFYDKIM